jgi:hypothetical protein
MDVSGGSQRRFMEMTKEPVSVKEKMGRPFKISTEQKRNKQNINESSLLD